MKHLFGKDKGEEHNFWMSYTDLMSGFLIVFIIATIIYQHENNKFIDFNNKLNEMGYDLDDAEEMLGDYIAKKTDMLNINDKFKDVFTQVDTNCYYFDSVECSIRLYPPDGCIFFKTDSSTMQPVLKNIISTIGRPFVEKAMELKENYPNMEIRIEGHTDTQGRFKPNGFIHNLELSSNRASSVYKFIYEKCNLTPEQVEFVEERMISVGYSYAKPLDVNGRIVPINSNKIVLDKSRRIEFRIISK